MPYIPEKEIREAINAVIDPLAQLCRHKGDLNYTVTRLIHMWIIAHGGAGYQRCSDAMNALTDAAREFYRRILGPYEDKKIRENGEVSPLEEMMNPVRILVQKGGGHWTWVRSINPNGVLDVTEHREIALTFTTTQAEQLIESWPASEGTSELRYGIMY